MFLLSLFSDPLLATVWLAAAILSLTVHEFAHALVAVRKGDSTPEDQGRLTLNPLAHLDPVGFIAFLLLGFGWAKPVPYDPRNLANPKRDALMIALAGPGSNLLLAVCAGLLLRSLVSFDAPTSLALVALVLIVNFNLVLCLFNLLPLPPLDGSKMIDVLFSGPKYRGLHLVLTQFGPQLLLMLIFLSMLTSINVFFFISLPAAWGCDLLVGTSCAGVLGF